ncbi:MAG: metallopeptidase TldD-related protein [Myxococcota bacterium]|nr:metallopeptidase TldD-related protein [Myxococcota bacterium]
MRADFEALVDRLLPSLKAAEVLTCFFEGEESDFVRFNHGLVRQAGSVRQATVRLELVDGRRHASASFTLSGEAEADGAQGLALIEGLRQTLPHLPEDPHLLYATEVQSTERVDPERLPEGGEMVQAIVEQGSGLDLVGILASGPIHRGFANSLGQRNWFTTSSFHLDWSLYHRADKAVKCGYAGKTWEGAVLERKLSEGRQQLEVMKRDALSIDPGSYRAYLAPAALNEILGLLSWGGFGLKEQRSRRSPLMRAADGQASLSPAFSLTENVAAGVAPGFGCSGFLRPDSVELFVGGCLTDSLVSPRSAKEYSVPTNGAGPHEMPDSLELAGGETEMDSVLSELDTGIWINNLWYLNYSDRPACRMTGMTRFATFWVEKGEIVAPLEVMRFDDTVYRLMGEGLVGLTRQQELVMDAGTYGGRSTSSTRLPGALVDDLVLTL